MIFLKAIKLKQEHIPVTKPSVRSSPPYLCQRRPWNTGVSWWLTAWPLLSNGVPFVISLDFQSFIRCSVGTRFPFWEGKQGSSVLWEDSLNTHLAVPIPSSVSAAPMPKAASFSSSPVTREKEPKGLLESRPHVEGPLLVI